MTIDLKAPVPSPFKADNTASNRCGFTLMNNQVGAVVAQVMETKPNVTVMHLPSMIRVDATNRMIEMGIIDPLRVCRSALENGASVAGLLLTTNTLVAEEQTPWGGSRALMTEFGQLDEGLHQPSPDSSTPQSLGLGPSVG